CRSLCLCILFPSFLILFFGFNFYIVNIFSLVNDVIKLEIVVKINMQCYESEKRVEHAINKKLLFQPSNF
ncbi:hypothetical protein P4V47_25880, partial [Brevibacillus laterosporus]|uniref:hypothetical protein n=1 Tax=Brevibacillus laterosporus TaxID=1465 RepID=UPI002E22120D|nr:hypothetical protein [Brevibacillus laterosporus]